MTFSDDNGNILEIEGEFAMTKQAVSFFNGTIKGDVSLNFDVPNTSVNRKTLNYNGPQMVNQVAFTKQPFKRLDESGNVLDRGYIVIQDEDGPKLDCFYVSGNSNWIQLITGLITELDYSGTTNGTDYTTRFTFSPANSNMEATGVIFPIIDFTYNLNKGNTSFDDGGPTIFNDSRHDTVKYPIFNFYPCFYYHSLIEEIMKQNGLKISGNLVNDPLYKSLIITPHSPQMKRKAFADVSLIGSSQSIPNGTTTKYTSFTVNSDPESLFSGSSYTANKSVGLIVSITCVASSGVDITSVLIRVNGLSSGGGTWVTGSQIKSDVVVFRGDVMDFYIVNTGGATRNATINVKIQVPDFVRYNEPLDPSNFLPAISCLDAFKFIITYFGCSVYFDEYSKTITANIIEQLKPENAPDWSNYYQSHRSEYTIDAAQNNYLRLSKNSLDSSIVKYNSSNTVGFGEGVIETGNTLVKNKDIVKFPVIPSASGIDTAGVLKANVPLINLIDEGDPIEFSAVTNLGTTSSFTVPDGTIFGDGEIVRIVNSTGADIGYFNVLTTGATTFNVVFVAGTTFTGLVYKQTANYQDVGFRILTCKNNISGRSDFSINGPILSTGSTFIGNVNWATFTKPPIGAPIDEWKSNCAIDNITGYKDPTVKQFFLNKISKIIGNPVHRSQMLLPKSVYQSFVFDSYIFLKTEKLTGYFWVENIVNYKNANTNVEVNLFQL